jgi:hypothetical protein
MDASEGCIFEYVGFASENLDLEGYRPVGSGQARNAESGKNRDSLRRLCWVSTDGGDALGEVRQGFGSVGVGRGGSLGVAGDCAVMDGADSEFGRNCGAQ